VPENGLVLYSGTVTSEDGRNEKKYTIDFEPYRPINQFVYLCDNKFHTEPLKSLLEDDDRFGFIIVDGNGTLFGAVQGNNREILQKIYVDLPKKHGRGGQSALRFSRLREEKRHNYMRKVAELTTHHFINVDRPNVAGLVLAGSANFKKELSQSDMFDARLAPIILKIVDVSYGMENGFNQAITLAQDALTNVKFIYEKKLVSKFFEEIALDTEMIVYGVQDTLKALEVSAIESLVVNENLEINRYEIKNPQTEEIKVLYLSPQGEKDSKHFKDEATGSDLDIIESKPLTEWLCENYAKYGAKLEFITDKSQEGFQFSKGFGGIGAFLRYKVDLDSVEGHAQEEDAHDDGFDTDEDFI